MANSLVYYRSYYEGLISTKYAISDTYNCYS